VRYLTGVSKEGRPLAHVLVASLFVQLFALATPIFFQLVVDKVLVHKGMSTLATRQQAIDLKVGTKTNLYDAKEELEKSQAQLFDEAGFADFDTSTVSHTFVLPSFDAYYGPFERGGGSTGQALAALPEDPRLAVREEARRDLGDTGGPVMVEAEYRIASGRA
jgi:hypothetical protein